MRELLMNYADTYANQLDKRTVEVSEQRSVNHPIVFLFLGDLVLEALTSIISINQEKWLNSSGVLYFHAYQSKTMPHENVRSIRLPHGFDRKTQRKDLYESFIQDETKLTELNKTFRQLTFKIAEYGKVYSSLKKANLTVVTAIDDPANILIQEFTLLLKSILQESFKSVEVDLYGLIKEKQDGDNFAFTTSLGISFLQELDTLQTDDYTYEKDLQLTEDQLRLTVKHPPSPLFDMVYLLSDKNEDGLLTTEATNQNYEIISNLNLLKNQKMITDYHEKMDSYHHQDFKRSIRGNSSKPVYASAGLAKVSRPNKAIALHAASHFFKELVTSLKASSSQSREKVLNLFELSESSFHKHDHQGLASVEKLEDMNDLLTVTNSYQAIKRMSVKEAEDYLYGGGTEIFFAINVEEPIRVYLQELDLRDHICNCLDKNIINNEEYGLFCAYDWTRDTSGTSISVIEEIQKMLIDTKNNRLNAEAKLDQQYRQIVDHCDFNKSYLPFSDKRNLTSFLNYFIKAVYGTKVEILQLIVKQAILQQYLDVLAERHRYLHKYMVLLDQVETSLKQVAAESVYDTDEYLDKNIAEYYAGIMSGIWEKLTEKRGPTFYSVKRFFGNLLTLLEKGADAFLERLLMVCKREVLTQVEFHRSFEDELLDRANVFTHYDNRNVLTKEALFNQLYQRLNDQSSIHIEVFNYTQKHRYEEKYFIGDFYSKFMMFAIDKEQETRQYKVGCAHELKRSGIEKLTLMGGFQLKDLLYYRNGERYYNAYCDNGYLFHAVSVKAPC